MEKQLETVSESDDMTMALDEEGFLKDYNAWSPGIALCFSKKDGIELTGDHWEIISFARNYFMRYKVSPMLKIIVKGLNREAGFEKYNIKRLFSLFPDRPSRSVCRYAGIPQPPGCT